MTRTCNPKQHGSIVVVRPCAQWRDRTAELGVTAEGERNTSPFRHRLLIGVFAVVSVGCGRSGLPAHSGDAAVGGSGGTSGGGGVDVDAAASGGIRGDGPVSGGSSGDGSRGGDAGSLGDVAIGSGGSGDGGAGSGGRISSGGADAGADRTSGAGGTLTGGSGGVGGRSSGGSTGAGGVRTGGAGGTASGGSGGMASGGGGAGGVRTGGAGGTASGGRGGASGSSSGDDGGGAGGILSSGYCTGDRPKVTYQGSEANPSVTNYRSGLVMDCCSAVGVNLHAKDSLGLDLQVEVIMSGIPAAGEYNVDASSFKLRATMRTGQETLEPMHLATGSLRFAGDPNGAKPWELGLCLQMDDASSPSFGTRIYVPSVAMCPYSGQKRLQFYLLQDTTLSSTDAVKVALESLTLATTPQLELGSIAYVEQSTGRIGLNPGQQIGTWLRNTIGKPNLSGLPFVVVADDVRIYLGSFTSSISSIRPPGPFVYVDGLSTDSDGITADGFVIHTPWVGTDPRNDPRITQVLTEVGKLVP